MVKTGRRAQGRHKEPQTKKLLDKPGIKKHTHKKKKNTKSLGRQQRDHPVGDKSLGRWPGDSIE